MSKIIIYGMEASPPTRACLLTLKALELPYELVLVNFLAGEHLLPSFLEKNPLHTVPLLEDGDIRIGDSHAIMAYLVRKYSSSDSLYPKDWEKRAIVDQRLHFDSSKLFEGAMRPITKSVLFNPNTTIQQSSIDTVVEVYDFVEKFLSDNDYVAGNELTIADFSFVSTLGCLNVYLELDPAKYPKMLEWQERLKELPYYEEANGVGAAQLEAMLKSKNFTIAA